MPCQELHCKTRQALPRNGIVEAAPELCIRQRARSVLTPKCHCDLPQRQVNLSQCGNASSFHRHQFADSYGRIFLGLEKLSIFARRDDDDTLLIYTEYLHGFVIVPYILSG